MSEVLAAAAPLSLPVVPLLKVPAGAALDLEGASPAGRRGSGSRTCSGSAAPAASTSLNALLHRKR